MNATNIWRRLSVVFAIVLVLTRALLGTGRAHNPAPTPPTPGNACRSAATADSLQIARRLSLALCGTVPSVEELRALERVPEDQRVAWWTERLLRDRRYADYFAERLARAQVGPYHTNTAEGLEMARRHRTLVDVLHPHARWIDDDFAILSKG